MGRVDSLWRYPIKSHSREALAKISVEAGRAFPYDREWAVAHEASRADGSTWAPCANFSRVAKGPGLAAIDGRFDEETGRITLTHPEREPLEFDPETQGDKLIAWAGPLMPQDRAASARVVRARAQAFTDTPEPTVTICNLASHRAVEAELGRDLSIGRWRGNIWLDGLGPWEEFEWVGREVRIGTATLKVIDRATRCLATHANPETGQRDADILGALKNWDHQDFSVYAIVTEDGDIALGDEALRL